MPSNPVLLDIGSDAYARQNTVDEVKRRMGIDHNYFDCWIFGFLENKNFNVDETVSKLQRRDEFEKTQLSETQMTDWMMDNMQKGIIQVIGNDKDGRVTFYICTARDKPSSARREESKMNFDMFVSYGTRLRPESKRCQMAMLINQDKASMWSNLDMSFQADIALRIAKFYPGCVDKMYICKMNRTLAALAKPIFSRLPAIVSERIIIISENDIKNGKLLELYDENVLPLALGGKNDCDKPENYTRFAYTIKEYCEQLKAAVKRGMSVKEWELQNLMAAGYVSSSSRMEILKHSLIDPPEMSGMRRRDTDLASIWSEASGCSGNYRRVNDADDDETLQTCDTLQWDNSLRDKRQTITIEDINLAPRDLLTDYYNQFATLETFFRINITEMYESEWLHMLQREVDERHRIAFLDDQIRAESFFRRLPPAVHLILRGFLWLCLLVMSCFFLVATLFIALVGIVTMTYILFAMLSHPYNVFLYGTALFVTGVQFTLFCSRGFDIFRNTFSGRLIQALKAFGQKALLFQVVIDVVCTVGYFLVFCIMSARYDPLTGIQYSVAIGWIVAVCLTFIYHVVFAFGFKEISKPSYRHGSRVNNAETTLYLFMDVDVEDDSFNNSPAEVVILTALGVLVFASGVCYMAGGGFFFLCAVVVLIPLLLLLCTVFMFSGNVGSASNVTLCAVAYAAIFWINAVFSMGLYGWTGDWGNSLLAALFIMMFFSIVCMVSIYGPWKGAVRRWLFRLSWAIMIAHLVGCTIALFVYNYKMGLFVLALAIHLLISCIRTNEASNNYGLFLVVGGFAITVLACCLLGNFGASEVYNYSVSGQLLPNYHDTYTLIDKASTVNTDVGRLPPICLSKFASETTLGIVGMSLFTKLGYNINADAQAADLQRWFPQFNRVAIFGDEDILVATAFQHVGDEYNTTVIAVRSTKNVMRFVESMTMWIDQYVISFFSLLMPPEYLEEILPYISFAQGMTPQLWRGSIAYTTDLMNKYISEISGTHKVYIVGHGPMGATAVTAALQANVSVKSVLLSAPEIVQAKHNLEYTDSELAHRLVSVQTLHSVYSTWFLKNTHTQVIPCRDGGQVCDTIDSSIAMLDLLCRI